jgi:hypothetical protein
MTEGDICRVTDAARTVPSIGPVFWRQTWASVKVVQEVVGVLVRVVEAQDRYEFGHVGAVSLT